MLALGSAGHPKSVLQSGPDAISDLLYFFGFLKTRNGEHMAVVLFEFLLQAFRQLDELSRVLNGFFVIGLQDFILLQFPIGQTDWLGGLGRIPRYTRVSRPGWRAHVQQ